MNYAQNSVLHDLIEAWSVCEKKFNKPWSAKFFSTDFDNWVTKVNNGLGTDVMQEGR